MRAAKTNEIQERRVIRLLAGLADDVPAAPADEIERAVRSACGRTRFVSGDARSRHLARSFSAVAAAAVVALACLVHLEAPREHTSSPASSSSSFATFPDGSALQLLLSASGAR